jgi:hypothetical protein
LAVKIRFDDRYFGFLGFLGFIGFINGAYPFYMLFMLFFFFAAARPQLKTGEYLSDERWAKNMTKGCVTAFFVFLIPSMLNVAFLRATNLFSIVSEAIPVAALLSLFISFYYFDHRGD